eukprot:m.476623 g.476623  ORF g.476623 m.476623 type:complete len:342 (-) comp20593_c0_seq1:202-1227(-)
MTDAESSSKLFETVPLSDFPFTPKGEIKCLRSDATVKEAVTFLHNEGILSAPVYDVSKPDTAPWKEKFLAILDVRNLVVFMLDSLQKDSAIAEVDESAGDTAEQVTFDLLPSEFAQQTVSKLTEEEQGWMPFLPIEETSSLLDAVILLGTYRLKRLPVVTGPEASEVKNIISQSGLIKVIDEEIKEFPLASKSLAELGMVGKVDVHCVKTSDAVEKAFELMREHQVSAIPVVGEDGDLVGNISAGHAYYVIVSTNMARLLQMTCTKFLASIASGDARADIRNTAITCKADDSLKNIVSRLASARIHRIYLVDDERRPLRVISLCDILSKFAVEPENGCCLL